MKLLVVGIDGGDSAILNAFDMPFTQHWLQASAAFHVTQHPFERGWASMLTGRPATDTRGLFLKPTMTAEPRLTIKYTLDEMLENPSVEPLWQMANRAGRRVGFMNVPTTYPAPVVDGFFVSGAGGGLNKVEGIPESMCHPGEAGEILAQQGYIVDYRFGTDPERSLDRLFHRLTNMMERRIKAFLALCERFRVDFGFIVLRAPTVIQYLGMAEIAPILLGGQAPTERWRPLLSAFYSRLDALLRELYQQLAPQHHILTSDHGTVPYLQRGNMDAFLIDTGYMARRVRLRSSLRRLRRKAAAQGIGRLPLRCLLPHCGDRHTARAFGNWYVPGIYINDAERFAGPVKPQDTAALVDDICARFNSSTEAVRHGMAARPYRRLHDGPYADALPDIWIDAPDTVFFDGGQGCLVEDNPDFAPLADLNRVTGGMFTGQKGRHPLLYCDRELAALHAPGDPTDLRLVYRLAERALTESDSR